MYTTVELSKFRDAFIHMDRKENFSYKGLEYLYRYLSDLEESLGEEMELDVIALCSEYAEEQLITVLKEYNLESLEELEDQTEVVNFDPKTGLVLYQIY